MYHECIAEAYSYKGDEFHMNGSYINKVLKEEVELFEWPSYNGKLKGNPINKYVKQIIQIHYFRRNLWN